MQFVTKSPIVDFSNPINRGLFAWFIGEPGRVNAPDTIPAVFTGSAMRDQCGNMNGGHTNGLTVCGNMGRPGGYRAFKSSSGIRNYYASSFNRPFSAVTDATWAAWLYPTSSSIGVVTTMLTGNYSFSLAINNTAGNWNLREANGGLGNMAATLNTWQHVIYTRTANRLQGYLNGVQLVDVSHSWGSITATVCHIAQVSNASTTFTWPGFFDDLRLYKRWLSEHEAKSLYQQSLRGYRRSFSFFDNALIYSPPVSIGYTIAAGHGSVSVTGQSVNLRVSRYLSAANGTVTVLGQAVNVTADITIAASHGTITGTGQSVGLQTAARIAASQGSVIASGQAAGLQVGRFISAEHATINLVGQNVSLRTAATIAAGNAEILVNGQSVGLTVGAKISAGTASVTVTGQSVIFRSGYSIAADHAIIDVVGQSVTFAAAYSIQADNGTIGVVGQSAELRLGRRIIAQHAAIDCIGQEVAIRFGRSIQAKAGEITVTGQSVNLRAGYYIAAGHATVGVVGQAVGFVIVRPETPRCAIVSVLPVRRTATSAVAIRRASVDCDPVRYANAVVVPVRLSRTTAEPIRRSRVTVQC